MVLFYLLNRCLMVGMKVKSHSWAKKRVKKSATGKYVFKKACNNHLLTNKKKKKNKTSPYGKVVSKNERKALKVLLPYV